MATKEQQNQFIEKMWNAIAGLDLHGLLPSVLIAQASLESDWGLSSLAAKYNNYFGVKKGSTWTGKTVKLKTREVKNGESVYVLADFRVYDSVAESIADRNKLLLKNKRYAEVPRATTAEGQAKALADAGYATGTKYYSTLMSRVNNYNLKEFDEKKKQIMNTKTISVMMLAIAVVMAGVGMYNLIKLR